MIHNLELTLDYVKKLKEKAKTLRQIHSNKLERKTNSKYIFDIFVIIVSLFFAFFSIMGVEKIRLLIFPWVDKDVFEFINNLIAIALLVCSLLQWGLKTSEEIAVHDNSIKKLSEFINDLGQVEFINELTSDECHKIIIKFGEKYNSIIATLPASTDKEHAKAKEDLKKKSVT